MSGASHKQGAAPLPGDAVAKNVAADEKQARLSKVATHKFHYEDIVNADPLCPPSALKFVRPYLNFVTDFRVPVYVSTIKLMAWTGLSTRTITDMRRLFVELGYFEPAGKTAQGAQLYRLKLPRESLVQDHTTRRS